MEGITIRALGPEDAALLCRQPPGLFDAPPDAEATRGFLGSPDCILFAALQGDLIVSFASGTVLRHPDKPRALFVNEVATRDSHLRRGLAHAVCCALFQWSRRQGIVEIWLGTEPENTAARALYESLGGKATPFIGYGWGGALDD